MVSSEDTAECGRRTAHDPTPGAARLHNDHHPLTGGALHLCHSRRMAAVVFRARWLCTDLSCSELRSSTRRCPTPGSGITVRRCPRRTAEVLMLPRTTVDIAWNIDYAGLRTPTEEDLEYGGFGSRQYSVALVLDATWEQALEELTRERAAVGRIAMEATSAGEFDSLAREEEETLEYIDDPNEGFVTAPDLGMNAACVALCAAGCVTAASCRGHPDPNSWADRPIILMTADQHRARLLEVLARESDCGLASTDDGRLKLWAASLDEMLLFAEVLIAHRQRFEALPLPPALEEASSDF
jgi:hypothetical protein